MASLTTVINQFLDNLFKVQATSLRISSMSDVASLHEAVTKDDARNVSSLIEHGADVNVVYRQETAFTRAVEGRHFRAADVIIISQNFDPNAKNQFDRSPLHVAAKAGQVGYVQKLIDMGARINSVDVRGVTPLSACGWGDHHQVAEILINHRADIDRPDHQGQTTLYRACSNVCINLVRLLLKHNCDVNLATTEKKTPLMAALPSYYNSTVARKKVSDMLYISEMLIKKGASLNSQDSQGKTALHLAVESNDMHSLCLLAESGCELNVKNKRGYTPFQTAVLPDNCKYDAARYLLLYGADVTQPIVYPDETSNTISPLSLVLNTQPQANAFELKWSRALLLRSLLRCVYPSQSMVKNSISSPVSYIKQDSQSFHETVEMEVMDWLNSCIPCSLQHQALLKVRGAMGSVNVIPKINLLQVGFGLKQKISLGLHPDRMPLSRALRLHLHIRDAENDKVKDIVESGADVHFPLDNRTPLALALEIGNTEAADIILKHHQSMFSSVQNASGENGVHLLAKYGRDSVLNNSINISAVINARNLYDHTPLEEAITSGHFTTAVMLINRGADVHVGGADGVPLIHLAAASGSLDVLRLLLERGEDPNMKDKFGNTPLHVAASKGFQYLKNGIALPALYEDQVSANLDIVQMNLTDSSPKYTSCTTKHAEVIQCLMLNGADPRRLNGRSQTPAQCAQQFKALDLLEVLNGEIRASPK